MFTENFEKANEAIKALAHPVRLSIIKYIDKNRGTNVNKIYNTLKLEQSITSQHLSVLRKNDIVIAERDGKFIYYNLNYNRLKKMSEAINKFCNNSSSFSENTHG